MACFFEVKKKSLPPFLELKKKKKNSIMGKLLVSNLFCAAVMLKDTREHMILLIEYLLEQNQIYNIRRQHGKSERATGFMRK